MIPRISIITPSFNQAQFLEKTIDSVLSQNYPHLQYIIIDGGSTDNSVEIIKKYEKHISYWESQPDSGQSHAINKGIQKSNGEVINWLNSDDYYEPNALKIVSEVFEDSSLSCLCGKSRLFDEKGSVKYSRGTDIYHKNLPKTIGWARIDQPETFFRKSAWDKVGLLNENLHYTMDREWWIRYLFTFGLEGISKTDDTIVNFRLHKASKTVNESAKFEIEHNSLFKAVASAADNTHIEKLIVDNLPTTDSLNSQLEKIEQKRLMNIALNYFLLKKADELYYRGNHLLCKKFLNNVDKQLLKENDRKLLNSISIKSTIPSSIIKLIRKYA